MCVSRGAQEVYLVMSLDSSQWQSSEGSFQGQAWAKNSPRVPDLNQGGPAEPFRAIGGPEYNSSMKEQAQPRAVL